MQHATGDETADFLLRQVRLMQRVGSPKQKADAAKWELIVRTHAVREEPAMAANFATAKPTEEPSAAQQGR